MVVVLPALLAVATIVAVAFARKVMPKRASAWTARLTVITTAWIALASVTWACMAVSLSVGYAIGRAETEVTRVVAPTPAALRSLRGEPTPATCTRVGERKNHIERSSVWTSYSGTWREEQRCGPISFAVAGYSYSPGRYGSSSSSETWSFGEWACPVASSDQGGGHGLRMRTRQSADGSFIESTFQTTSCWHNFRTPNECTPAEAAALQPDPLYVHARHVRRRTLGMWPRRVAVPASVSVALAALASWYLRRARTRFDATGSGVAHGAPYRAVVLADDRARAAFERRHQMRLLGIALAFAALFVASRLFEAMLPSTDRLISVFPSVD